MLIPYPELRLVFDKARNILDVETPWVSLKLEIDRTNEKWIDQVVEDTRKSSPPSRAVHEFLEQLKQFPLAIQLPREGMKVSRGSIFVSDTDQNNLWDNKYALKKILDEEFIGDTQQKCLFIRQSKFQAWQNKEWAFDFQSIKSQSKINGIEFYDPITAFQLIRRQRLINELQHNFKNKLIDFSLPNLLSKSNVELFKKIMVGLFRINHFVTKNCKVAIEPALKNFPLISTEIKEFLKDEKGHDKLMELSLRKLGIMNPDEIPLYMDSISSVSALYYASQHSAFALLCLIDAFEGVTYQGSDPLADLMRQSPWPAAAVGIERHFNINKDGDHHLFSLQLLEKLPAISLSELMVATRLCEIFSESDNLAVKVFLDMADSEPA